jgi:hypothetical protein
VNRKQAAYYTWCGDGGEADMELLLRGSEVCRYWEKIHIAGCRFAQRGLGKKIVQDGFSDRLSYKQKSPSAQGRQHRFRHATGEQGGESGIKGVAAITQYVYRRLGGDLVASGNDPFGIFHNICFFRRYRPVRMLSVNGNSSGSACRLFYGNLPANRGFAD